jgi:hypothetical protein
MIGTPTKALPYPPSYVINSLSLNLSGSVKTGVEYSYTIILSLNDVQLIWFTSKGNLIVRGINISR